MVGASTEATLELWASSLRAVKGRVRPLFTQARVAASAGLFLDGLLGPERRKTGWMRAEAAGDPGPWRQQAILGRGRWEADAMRDVVRDYALETLADPDAVLVIDETGFLKQGRASCGVGRHYTGSAGKVTNCQIGVFAAYVSRHGHGFVDRALYLPKAWTDDAARLAAAHVPDEVRLCDQAAPGPAHGRACPGGRRAVCPSGRGATGSFGDGSPAAMVAADGVYGVSEVEKALRGAGKGYALGVSAAHPFNSWIGKPAASGTAESIAQALDTSARQRLSAGEGTKGPRRYDWAHLELADLDADEFNEALSGAWTRGLLIRRNLADGACAFFTTWCPASTRIKTLVRVEGQRWAIEGSFDAVSLIKIANDLRLLGSGPRCGLGELILPPDGLTSSIMPGKTNPTVAEVVLQAAFQVIGNHAAITVAGASGSFELNVAKPVIAYNLLQSIRLMAEATERFAVRTVDGIAVNGRQLEKNVAGAILPATALNPVLGTTRSPASRSGRLRTARRRATRRSRWGC